MFILPSISSSVDQIVSSIVVEGSRDYDSLLFPSKTKPLGLFFVVFAAFFFGLQSYVC